uniref:PKD domain-containing protein n=1 Tax=Archaeoglobus fulgidus TaxID=2234 RepID=A0A7J2TJP8_ARCFL
MKMKILIPLLIILIPVSALQLQISGSCVGEEFRISADKPSLFVIRINDGTPIFAEGSEVIFRPQVEGYLRITAISGSEVEEKILKVSLCPRRDKSEIHVLPSGSFEKVVEGKSYSIEWRTALGALEMASRIKGFSYTLKATDWGLFVDCIKNLCTGHAGKTSGWMYWVNYPRDPLPNTAAQKYRVKPGDVVTWYFSRGMSDNPENSQFLVNIYIGTDYEIFVQLKWEENMKPAADFDFDPKNPAVGDEIVFDASKSYDPDGFIVDYIWEFGDGEKASGKVVKHAYKKEGSYQVILTVWDNNGATDSISKIINVFEKKREKEWHEFCGTSIDLNLGTLRKIEFKTPLPLEVKIRKTDVPDVIYADVYECFEFYANRSVQAELLFEIPASWGNVSFYRYNGSWIKLESRLLSYGENLTFRVFVDSLSHVAVAKDWENFPLKEKDPRIIKALSYLKSLQRSSGGFANPNEEESVAKTSWAVMAIVASGQNPRHWVKDGMSPIDYIREKLPEEIGRMGTADYARTILALYAAGENPRNFAGIDLVAKLKERIKDNGQIGDFVYTTIWGILALSAVGENVSKSVEWLKAQQNPDGGFAWAPGEESDFDDTAAAIQALIAANEPRKSEVIKRALDYLKSGQNEDGGMRFFGNSASNAASDAWTIQALVSAGVNPMEWRKNNSSVVEHLLSLQTKSGHFRYTSYSDDNPGYMTACAIISLLGKTFPIKPLRVSDEVIVEEKTPAPQETPTVQVLTPEKTVFKTPAERTPGFGVLAAVLAIAIAVAGIRR